VRVVLESEDGKEKLGFHYLSRDEEKASKPPKPPSSSKPRKPRSDGPGGGTGGGTGRGTGGGLVPRVSRRPAGRKSEPAT
jgi:hypothetical protein